MCEYIFRFQFKYQNFVGTYYNLYIECLQKSLQSSGGKGKVR